MKLRKRLGILAAAAAIAGCVPAAVFADGSYTYNYDYWGDVQYSPDVYTVARVFTSADLGLEQRMKTPAGLFADGNRIYICDSGNNRILELEMESPEDLELVRIIDSFQGDVEVTTLSNPTDIVVSEDGNLFIADQGNKRILKLDGDLNYLAHYEKPIDNTLDPATPFQPNKLAVDTAERVYCIAGGINQGLIKYENDGTFSGFVGATKVTFDWTDYLWKKFASQEQRAQMVSFVPTEYTNIYMDHEGFIYGTIGATSDDDESKDVVRKLNLMGKDILVRNGNYPIIGDLYQSSGGNYSGPSFFADITVLENDIYVCLDRNRGRLFGYDDQGRMVFAFGGNGNMDGYFRRPVAVEHIGNDLFVLDTLDCALTVFVPTEFGNLIYDAVDQFDEGDYEASTASWERVMALNGNYDLAYIGLGRSLLRQERYHEAMEYFELKYDGRNWSKAYKQYRKEWVQEHILPIVIVILALFLIPLIIGRIRAVRREIDRADIFQPGFRKS